MSPGRPLAGPVPRALAVATASGAAGLLLTAAGLRLGAPLLAFALPVVGLLLAWALSRPLVAAALVPVTLPVGLVALPGGVLQVVQLVAVTVAGVVVVHRLTGGRGALPLVPGTAWMTALVLLLVLATPSAADTLLAVRQIASMVAGVLLALALAEACRTMRDVRLVVGLLLAAGVWICGSGLSAAGQVSSSGAVVTSQLTGSFAEKNQYGGFSAVLLVVAAGLLLGARTRRSAAGALVGVVVPLAAMMLSLSRGAWIGAVLGAFVLLVLVPRARRVVLLAALPLVTAAALLGAFAPSSPQVALVRDRVGSIADPSANPYDDRPSIWREAVREVRLDPWTGQGPGSFPVVARRSASEATFAVPEHAHNVLLTVAAEVGLPAVAVVVGLTLSLAGVVRRAVRRLPDPRDAAVLAGLAGGLAVYAGQGLVDFTLRNPVLLALLWTLVGLVLAAARTLREEPTVSRAVPTPAGRYRSAAPT